MRRGAISNGRAIRAVSKVSALVSEFPWNRIKYSPILSGVAVMLTIARQTEISKGCLLIVDDDNPATHGYRHGRREARLWHGDGVYGRCRFEAVSRSPVRRDDNRSVVRRA